MSPTGSMSPPRGKDQPTLSVKQVMLLCERLWKEREEKLREEYDHVLNDRLSGELFSCVILLSGADLFFIATSWLN